MTLRAESRHVMRAPPRPRTQSAGIGLLARGAGVMLAIAFLVQAGGRPVALIPQAQQERRHVTQALAAIQVNDLLGQAGVLLERGPRHRDASSAFDSPSRTRPSINAAPYSSDGSRSLASRAIPDRPASRA